MSRSSTSSSKPPAAGPARVHPFLRRMMVSSVAAAIGILIVGSAFLNAANEMDVFSRAVIEQADDVLWGPAFGQQHAAYKIKRAVHTRPDFLILGSSRVTQFRDVMGPKDVRFYNGALAASSLSDARDFLLSLYDQHPPKTVLLGLDPWWFRPGRSRITPTHRVADFSYPALLSTALRVGLTGRVIRSLIDGKLDRTADPLARRKPVGYHAALTGNGFRADGSYQYGDILTGKNPQAAIRRIGYGEDFHFYRHEITDHRGRFAYTGPLDKTEQNLLETIAEEAKARNVTLILFFPPMATAVMDAVNTTPDQRAYFKAVKDTVAQVARKAGIEFHNFHDLAGLNIDDRHTLDGIHVDEIASLAMLNAMIDNSPVLRALYDQDTRDEKRNLVAHKNGWAGRHRIVP